MKRSEMFRERNERPSTAGLAEERSGYMELCEGFPAGVFSEPSDDEVLPK